MPSRAMAKGTRAVPRIEVCSDPKDESIITPAIKLTASGPSTRLVASAATDEATETLFRRLANFAAMLKEIRASMRSDELATSRHPLSDGRPSLGSETGARGKEDVLPIVDAGLCLGELG